MCKISVPSSLKVDIRRVERLHHDGAGQDKTSSSGGNRRGYINDHFMMYVLKVTPCTKKSCHDWSECPYAHKGEKAARRDPATFLYTGVLCPDVKKKKVCPRGDDCPFAHTVFEYWLHPTRFRTVFCAEGNDCMRKFCFFAHSPEELREPELAELQSPLERRTPEGTPLHVSSSPNVAPEAANNEQTPNALIESLVEILKAEPEEIKKKLEVAQGNTLPAQGTAQPKNPKEPSLEPLQSGMHGQNACTCGCGGKSGKRQREPADVSSDIPVTQLELAAYLAGYQYALGLRNARAMQIVPHPQPQPFYPSSAVAEQGVAACNQSSFQEPSKMGLPWAGDIEACCTALPALLNPFDYLTLPHQSPLPEAFAPVTCSPSNQPPNNPFSNTWDEAVHLGACAADPLPSAATPLNAGWDGAANHFQQPGSSLDRGLASSLLDSSPSSMESTSCGLLDPVVDFHGSPLSSHAAPFDHLTAKHNSPRHIGPFPEFSLY